MAVDNYTTVDKKEIDRLIAEAIENNHIACNPIEHYNIEELKEIAEKARKNDLVVTIHAEHSNFYQGVMVHVIKRKNIDETFVKYI